MRREQRLRKANEFAATRRTGKSYSDNLLVLVACPNNLDVTRFGFTVGRKIGKAVVRNKIKRRLREVVSHASIDSGWDMIFIARRGALSADFQSIRRSAAGLLKRNATLHANHQRLSGSP